MALTRFGDRGIRVNDARSRRRGRFHLRCHCSTTLVGAVELQFLDFQELEHLHPPRFAGR
uniref:Uncharacterized protein n=1 Tax=Physcomitrium patens TaxID=3218 RepID=A0A2K1L6Q8_PHYPA|nr:hypothetical protein PHYPA_000141 [Physcomitrium patens]